MLTLQKLEHRLFGLERVSWQDNTKEEVRAVLIPEYTSSDESEYSEDVTMEKNVSVITCLGTCLGKETDSLN